MRTRRTGAGARGFAGPSGPRSSCQTTSKMCRSDGRITSVTSASARSVALRRLERAAVGAHHAVAQPELASQRSQSAPRGASISSAQRNLNRPGGKDTLVSVCLSVCLSLSVDKMR